MAQWVTGVPDAALPEVLGGHYVFAGFDQTEVALAARLNWIFSPRLSLQIYTQPLVSRGSYAGFKELERPRSFDFLAYGPGPDRLRPGHRLLHRRPGPGLGSLHLRQPRLQLQVAPAQRGAAVGVAPGLGDLRGVGAAAREHRQPGSSDLAQDLDTLLGSPATDAFQVKATFRLGD